MIRIENRPRSLSTTSREKCVHPGLRPVSVTDAEQLLRSLGPLAEEDEEDEFLKAVLPEPKTPEEAIRCAKLQAKKFLFHNIQQGLLGMVVWSFTTCMIKCKHRKRINN
jgi:hypothetical protein